MVFLVRGTLSDGGSIFGKNELTSLIQAEVGVGNEYWLIYLMVPPPKPGETSFDIGQLINNAFNLGLTGLHITVNNAGFFQLNAKAAQYAEIVAAYPQIPFPSPTSDPDFVNQALQRLTCFWAIIDFSSWDIGNSLLKIGGTNGGQSTLRLYGFFSSGDGVKTTVFEADFPTFSLFNLFTFSDIRIRYQLNTDTLYSLSGKLAIVAFQTTFAFTGLVEKQSDRFFAALTLTIGPETVTDPFGSGSMPGITFAKLQFALLRPYPAKESGNYAWFQASVKYTINAVAIDLDAGIYMVGTTPALAFIVINQDLNIGDIFTNSIPGFTWPSDLINLVFKKGSSLYYCQSGYAATFNQNPLYLVDPNGNLEPVSSLLPANYQDGFTIFAPIDLTIWKTISLTGNITIGKNHVAGSIQLNEVIDLYFLTLSAPSGTSGTGPVFQFDSKPTDGSNPYVQFQCGLLFFQENFGLNAAVKLSKDTADAGAIAVEARLSTTQRYVVFNNQPVSLTFTYSKKTGFNVSGWPSFTQADSSINQIFDIAKEVTALMKSADPTFICGQITNLISEQLYTNSFTMSPTFETVNQNGTDIVNFVLNGTFSVSIADQQITTIPFPKTIVIPLPKHLSLNDLPNEIIEALKNAAESFIQSLMNNGEQWAKLAAILFAEKASELAAQWLCEALIDSITAEAITAGAAAFSGALGGGAGLAGAIGAGLGVVGGIFSSCFTAGTLVRMADGSERPIESVQLGDVLLGYHDVPNRVLAFDHPKLGKRTLYAFNDGPYFVTAEHPFLTETGWKSIDPIQTLSENPTLSVGVLREGDVILGENGSKIPITKISFKTDDPQKQLYNFKLSGNNTYIANRLIAHNKGSSCFAAGTRVLLANGATKRIEEVAIGDVLLGMHGHSNTVSGFDHPLLGERALFAFNGGEFFVTAEHPFYTSNGWKAIDPVATAAENPDLQVGKLVTGDVLFLHDGGTVELVTITACDAPATTPLYNFVLDGNHTYFANGYLVHNKGGGGGGGGHDPDPQQPTITQPALTYLSGTLTYAWNGAVAAAGYEAAFFDPAGTQIGQTQSLGQSQTTASTAITLVVTGGTFKARVRSTRGSKRSDWTEAQIDQLAEATGIQLKYDVSSDTLTASWNAVNQATSYLVALQWNNEIPTSQTIAVRSSAYPAETLEAGTYRVFVTGQASNTIPASPTDGLQRIIKPAAPTNVLLNATGSQLVVTWTNEAETTYTIELLKDGVPAGEPQNSSTGRVTFQQTSAGNYTARVRVTGSAAQLPGAWGSSAAVTQLPAPANVHFSFDAVQDQLRINWDSVTGNNGYSVQVFNSTTGAVEYTGQVAKNTNLFTLPLAQFTAGEGPYQAKVSAEAEPGSLDSSFAVAPEVIHRMAAPTLIALTYSATLQQLSVSWSNVAVNNGYLITLYNELTPGTPVSVTSALKDAVSSVIPLSEVMLLPGTYQAKVVTLAASDNMGSLPGISDQGVTKAGTPVLQSALFANNLVTMAWTAVPGATAYQLVLAETDQPTTHTASDSPATFSVSDLTKGNYTASVIATGQGWIDSDSSNQITVAVNSLSIDALAAQFFTGGSSATATGAAILLAFPTTDYVLYTKVLAQAGYLATDTVQALKAAFPTLTAQQVTQALQNAYGTSTPEALAKQGKAKGWSAVQTGQEICSVFPGITATDFAVALAGAVYTATATTEALSACFPGLSPQELTAALKAAFGTMTPGDFAKQAFESGKTATETGEELVANYPGISSVELTRSLAVAGYTQTDTVQELKTAFPNLTAIQFTSIVIAVYSKQLPENYAKASFANGADAVQTGQLLLSNFPGISANDFTQALAQAGYTAAEATQALKNSFPKLTPQQFTAAIQTAYS